MKKPAVLAALALAATLAGGVAPVTAETASPTPSPEKPQTSQVADLAAERAATLDGYKRSLAEQIARKLDDGTFRAALKRELAGDGQADLAGLFASVPSAGDLTDYTRRANSDILRVKGFQATGEAESLLELRIDPADARKISSARSLVMFTPSGDDSKVRTVTAYDSTGRTHELDAHKVPERPVLIVGLDEGKSAELAQKSIREALTKAGVTGTDRVSEAESTPAPTASLNGQREVSSMSRILMRYDHEPWYKGSPELYAWVAGAGTDGKARVDTIEMPYVKEEMKNYYPNQSLIEWGNYSWTAVDVVFMEHDDNADLSGLVKGVVEAALTISGNGQYVAVADKIVGALPSGWVTDSDDWVDSCYSKTRQSTLGACAANPVGVSYNLRYGWI